MDKAAMYPEIRHSRLISLKTGFKGSDMLGSPQVCVTHVLDDCNRIRFRGDSWRSAAAAALR
jgi:hypothetical protein